MPIRSLKDINWNHIYCFYEVARKQSMKEASKLLGVSIPTISDQIKRLEELGNAKLFHRSVRSIKLTPLGQKLFSSAKEVFDAGSRVVDVLFPAINAGYSAKVGIQETIAESLAINFVSQYWDLYAPYGTVNTVRNISPDLMIERIFQGQFDWGICLNVPRSLKLDSKKILTTEIAFCCSPTLFERFKAKEDILRNIPLARSSWDEKLNEATDDCLIKAGIFPEEIIESDHIEFCISLAERGRCVVTLPKETIETARWGNSLIPFSLHDPIKLHLYAVWLKENNNLMTIKKMKDLTNLDKKPQYMNDPEFQLKINEVSENVLRN